MPGRLAIEGNKTNQWLLASLPLSPYEEIWELQKKIVEAKVKGILSENVVLVLEHKPVFTLGKRGNRNHLHVSEAFLRKQNIPLVHVERGGDVTFHGPGQLVVYPIVDLRAVGIRVVDFVERLEEVMIRVALELGIKASRNPANRGIWVGPRKLGSIGIAVRHGVTFHGLALNVNVSLEPFSWINPCGLQGVSMTSLSELIGEEVNMEQVRHSVSKNLGAIFGVDMFELSASVLRARLVRKPPWLRTRLPNTATFGRVNNILRGAGLHTVCEEALCPNRWQCYSRNTATFLILGDCCTRNCSFCAVRSGVTQPPDPEEPRRVAESAAELGLDYVVVTSVTRDDLADGGAGAFVEVVARIRERLPRARIELLVPDFRGDKEALRTVLSARPDVLNHNVETVPRLYGRVRPGASYTRSLEVLKAAKEIDGGVVTKSGLMLGLGEKDREIDQVLSDLLDVGCDVITLGQYLPPSPAHIKVARYVRPEEFERWKEKALGMGFKAVASGPLVRSSYRAKELYEQVRGSENQYHQTLGKMA